MTPEEKLERAADSFATVCLGVDRNDDMYYGFHAGANWQASQHEWVSVKDRLPTEADAVGRDLEISYKKDGKWRLFRCTYNSVNRLNYDYWRTPLPNNFPEPPKTEI
jgi:hypothetical protein